MVSSLLLRSNLRFLQQHRWQTILTITGIVLGVAVVVAVDLANVSARRAFALSLDSVTGRATHQLTGGSDGIDESLYVQMRRTLGLHRSAPLISDYVSIAGQTFLLLGIDPIAELGLQRHALAIKSGKAMEYMLQANRIVMSARSADKLHLKVGDSLSIDHRARQQQVTLGGIFHSKDPAAAEGLIFTDISVAQELLNRVGTLDQIDLQLTDSELARLKAWIPDTFQLADSHRRNDAMRNMTEVFHLNLTAMSLLALLVGGLLILNSMTFSILQRRGMIGTLRLLGVTRREVFWLVMAEAGLIGFIGTCVGIAAGILLGQGLVHLVLRTVNDLYFVMHVSEFYISPMSLFKGLLLGMGTTIVAAWLPAREAMHSPPASVQQRSTLEQRWRLRMPLMLSAGIIMSAAGWLLILFLAENLLLGFFALTLIVFGFSFMVPVMLLGLVKLLLLFSSLASSRVRMVVRSITANMSRTGLAVAALTVAVAATIGVGIMVDSFRYSVSIWLQQSLNGDVYISLPGRSAVRTSPGLPAALVTELRNLPGVQDSSSSRMLKTETDYGQLNLLAIDNMLRNARGFNLKHSVKNIHQAMQRGEGVLISEPLANHHQLSIGNSIRIQTDNGAASFLILGVFYDYTSTQGLIIMERGLYEKFWRDRQVSGMTLFRQPSISSSELKAAVKNLLKSYSGHITVRSNREIRDISLQIFDQTFAITDVLELLVILVAFVGILSALMSLLLERSRELAILRASGMTPLEVAVMVIAQTLLMGSLAGILAIPLGLIMSFILIDVINMQSFGWSIQHLFPLQVIFQGLILSLTAAFLAGCYPAYRTAQVSPSQALREE